MVGVVGLEPTKTLLFPKQAQFQLCDTPIFGSLSYQSSVSPLCNGYFFEPIQKGGIL